MSKGKNATFEASAAFKNIATSSGETLRTSRDILSATEVQQNSISDVVKYVEEVVAIAEQTATGTQQVAGTARQLSSSMQELTIQLDLEGQRKALFIFGCPRTSQRQIAWNCYGTLLALAASILST